VINVEIEDPTRLVRIRTPAPVLAKGHRAERDWRYPQAGPAEQTVMIERSHCLYLHLMSKADVRCGDTQNNLLNRD
jgi:hypothetical protein